MSARKHLQKSATEAETVQLPSRHKYGQKNAKVMTRTRHVPADLGLSFFYVPELQSPSTSEDEGLWAGCIQSVQSATVESVSLGMRKLLSIWFPFHFPRSFPCDFLLLRFYILQPYILVSLT